jgi:hypothetical protein
MSPEARVSFSVFALACQQNAPRLADHDLILGHECLDECLLLSTHVGHSNRLPPGVASGQVWIGRAHKLGDPAGIR